MSLYFILIIIGINITYVALFTIRVILVIKGQRFLASVLSMLEVFVYLIGLSIVLDSLNKPIHVVAYCFGWGMGVYVGSKFEEYLALGHVIVQAVIDSQEVEVLQKLRERGYGVTSWMADGKDGKRLVVQVLTKRSCERELVQFIHHLSPHAFVISYEPKNFKGGFLVKKLKIN
jgi:uncharacterized protein YebE (UPF0316 family)